MSFALTKVVNPPTAFLANWSELSDRLDPEMALFRRRTHDFKYPAAKLKAFFSEPPQYGAGERGLERENEEQPRYIRITDIDEFGTLTSELGATAATIEPRYILEDYDLLIARSGNTVGKSYLHSASSSAATCFFAGYLIRFRFRRNELLPEYVFAFTQLPYYKEWVRATQRAAGQPNINAQEYSHLEIPVAPTDVQRKVANLLTTAYEEKRRLDKKAQLLLLGIDDLLLDELGIPRKPDPTDTLESRIFHRNLTNLTGGRFDPIANQDKRRCLEAAIRSSRYPVAPLRQIVGFSKVLVNKIEVGEAYIGLENIDTESGEYIVTFEKESVGTAVQFESGQILFPKLRPYLNKTHLAGFAGIASTEFHVLTVQGANADYLASFLRSKSTVGITSLLMTGNTLPRLQTRDVEHLLVPVPPPSVQKNLCEKIEAIRSQARSLREQARSDLEQAKRDIEALILGKDSTP